ncbi:O-antigen ligase family protein [Pseudochryseolinea flava]|nr:O-antigen ligase family protein [Pseudochryseolinea flava]
MVVTKLFVAISFILWAVSSIKYIRYEWGVYGKFLFLFASLYLINIPGLILTEDMDAGYLRLESRLSYLIFPLLVFFSDLDRHQLRAICYAFIVGLSICSFISLAEAGYNMLSAPPDVRSFDQITYLNLVDFLDLHPSFVTVFVSFAVFFIAYDLYTYAASTLKRGILIGLAAYLCVFNFLLQSRAPLAAFVFIVLAFVLVLVIRSQINARMAIAGIIVLLVVVGIVVFNSKSVVTRMQLGLDDAAAIAMKSDFEIDNSASSSLSTVYHLRSWYCAIDLLSDHHFFTGYGSGDEKDVLQPCYESHGWVIMMHERQNAHNEYLSSMIRTGITELLLLVGCLFIPCLMALRSQNYLYVAFLLMWMATFLFNTLNLQSALFFFTMFNAILFRMMKLNQLGRTDIQVPNKER